MVYIVFRSFFDIEFEEVTPIKCFHSRTRAEMFKNRLQELADASNFEELQKLDVNVYMPEHCRYHVVEVESE